MSDSLQQFYEQDGVWGEDVASEERVAATCDLVPEDARRILDVGCGEGSLIRLLRMQGKQVFGSDFARAGLLHCSGSAVQANSASLPFPGRGFDLVLCTEVLEHLPQMALTPSARELERVADRWLLISTPYREHLPSKFAKCGKCGCVYHIHRHLRSFDEHRIALLFPEFRIITVKHAGPMCWRYFSPLLLFRQGLGKRYEWEPTALCPQCGAMAGKPPRGFWSMVTTVIAQTFSTRRAKWVIVLLERKS